MLALTNTSAAPGLDRYDPDRWEGRRLRDEGSLPTRESVTTFGHGSHRCPAQRFSLSAITRTVRRLTTNYELDAQFTAVRPITEQIGGVARAADPCPIAYRARLRTGEEPGRTEREREDREHGIDGTVRHVHRSVHDPEIVVPVHAPPSIGHRRRGVVAHPAGAGLVLAGGERGADRVPSTPARRRRRAATPRPGPG